MITDNKKITGKVTDEKNEPIIGANVVVKGSTTGTITDMDGNFTLEVPDQATLLVSYIGYTPKEVAVKNQNNLSIMMIEDSKTIDEVVVIGYGSVKKSNLTGAVSSVKTTNSYDFYRPRISRPGFRCTSYANFGYARSGSVYPCTW